MHTPEKAKYPFITLIEVFASLLNYKQGENEDLVSYLSRFKSEKDVVENLFGKEYLHGYIKRTQEYQRLTDADEKKEKLVEGMEQFYAVLFLRNSDQSRYGKLVEDYCLAYAGEENKYPRKLSTMIDIMRAQPKKKSTNKKPNNRDKGNDKSRNKDKNSIPEASFGQEEYACWCCGKPTCNFKECKKRATLPKERWHQPEKYVENPQQSNAQEAE